ncbi:MAG TPA: hypothetical protein DEH78_23820, partial [Solibacterales bacterium]|nr:hypothetical protein [Bryobacterales bacterium]
PWIGQMQYDAEGRVKSFTSGSNSVAFDYDAEGRRVKKTTSAGTVVYVYDATGALAAEYGSPIEIGTRYVTTDHLGSTRAVTTSTGAVKEAPDYLPFGEQIPGNATHGNRDLVAQAGGVGVPVRFTGKERDGETGLDYFGARYMSAAQGGFTSPDPVMLSKQRMFDPQQWNMYAYSRNNPLSMIDPDGREVKVLDDEALNRIRSTVPENLRSNIKLDNKGFIDKKALAKVKTKDENFNDLRTAANASGTLEVATASSVSVGEFGNTEFFFTSKEEMQKERDANGIISTEPAIDQLFLGYTDQGSNGATRVTLSDGTGKAATTPMPEHAATAAHEIYGHGLPKIQGRPWKHDDRGPIDRNIKRIEDRTKKLYGK